jgi:signal transduction histidine kinase
MLLEEVLPEDEAFNDFEVAHDFDDIGERVMLLNGRRLDHVQKVLVAIEDITERKQAMRELEALTDTLEDRVERRTEKVRELASRLTMAEQEERRRIAQILHDDLQQQLYATQFQLARLRRRAEDAIEEGDEDAIEEGDEDAQKALTSAVDEAEEHVKRGIETTRQLSVDLSPPVLSEEGLVDALGWLATQMKKMYGLTVEVEAEHAFYLPNEDHRVLLFQAVRELLFNVVKHADADRATVTLTDKGGQMVIRVEDGGSGFDPDAVASGSGEAHFGLQSIHERLDLFDGRLEIDSAPEEGTRATVFAPLQFYRTQDTPPEPGEQTGGEDGDGE